jgi:hypothetical protein
MRSEDISGLEKKVNAKEAKRRSAELWYKLIVFFHATENLWLAHR